MHVFHNSLSLSVIPGQIMFLVALAIAAAAVLITILCVAICVMCNIRRQDRTMYVTYFRRFLVESAIQLAIYHGHG